MFDESFLNIVTITFTALIYIELLNVYFTVNKIKFLMLVATIFTLLTYMGTIILFR